MRLVVAIPSFIATASTHQTTAFRNGNEALQLSRLLHKLQKPLVIPSSKTSFDSIIVAQQPAFAALRRSKPCTHFSSLQATLDSNEENGEPESIKNDNASNPYADPNYPELEFVNYDDPEYEVDQGVGADEFFSSSREEENDRTLAEIESMREERRRRNDEYQFETYHAKVLRGGEVSLGEWTVFQTDTFMGKDVVKGRHPEASHVPRLMKWDKVLKVVSRGERIVIDEDAAWRVDGERIVHEQRLATTDDFPHLMNSNDDEGLSWEEEEHTHVSSTFWPAKMNSFDFRGPGGNMCVGKAYTICDASPLSVKRNGECDEGSTSSGFDPERHKGPFSAMRTELGIQEAGMRFRIKLDYSILDDIASLDLDSSSRLPPLHLRTLTVCRETLDGYWPNPSDNGENQEEPSEGGSYCRPNQSDITSALFGPPGAPGGLYDPPPVGSEERAVTNYMLLDFEGGATVLLPHRLDQRNPSDDGDVDDGVTSSEKSGWVTSLDWTPGRIRYQVDRKVLSGAELKGLRTLELSEVQSSDADKWRPRDGGTNMRQ